LSGFIVVVCASNTRLSQYLRRHTHINFVCTVVQHKTPHLKMGHGNTRALLLEIPLAFAWNVNIAENFFST
jgi:hypothetical protein